MKRILLGCVWFVVIYLVVSAIGGGIVGAMAGSGTGGFEEGYGAGSQAGQEFGEKWGTLILVGSLLIAIAGTATGILPGTKKTTKQVPPDPPESQA